MTKQKINMTAEQVNRTAPQKSKQNFKNKQDHAKTSQYCKDNTQDRTKKK